MATITSTIIYSQQMRFQARLEGENNGRVSFALFLFDKVVIDGFSFLFCLREVFYSFYGGGGGG